MTAQPQDDRQTVPFSTVLAQLNGGNTHAELSRTLQELVEAVKATGKKGSLSFTLAISESKADAALDVVASVKSRLPEPKQFATIFYVDGDSNLVRKDPRQTELEFSPVRVADAPGKAAGE